MVRDRRRRIAWAVPVLLLLAVLIVAALAFTLANLDSGPEGRQEAPPASAGNSQGVVRVPALLLAAVAISLMALVVVAVVILILRPAERVKRPGASWWDLLTPIFALGILAAVLFFGRRSSPTASASDPANATVGTGGFDTVWPASAILPLEVILLASIGAALLWIVYRFRRASGSAGFRGFEVSDGPRARSAAAVTIQETIDALEFGGDVRATILECFRRFCRLLGSRGIEDQEPLTPRELEALAIERLRVSWEAPEALTSLFEEARYSEHRLGEADRARAIESLSRIRTALEA